MRLWWTTVIAVLLVAPSSGIAEVNYVRPLEGRTFCVEAGSGGVADETAGQSKMLSQDALKIERQANVYVALFLKEMLEIGGAKAALLGSDAAGTKLSISEKMNAARSAGAECVISIHHSVASSAAENAATVYCYPQYKEPETTLGARISQSMAGDLGVQERGVRTYGFPLLREATVPTIMVCPSCITNPEEQKRLANLDYNRTEALSILKGMIRYYSPTGSVPTPLELQQPPAITATPQPIGLMISKPVVFQPQLLNPVNGTIAQSWMFGEKYRNLPAKYGISFLVPKGTDIVAAGDGTVIAADASGQTSDLSPYRNYIIIRHDGLIEGKEAYTVYGQLLTISVKQGERVKRGQKIGVTDEPFTTSQLRSKEFEFEVRIGGNTQAFARNPDLYINHTSQDTGLIVGKMMDSNGTLMNGATIRGVKKPSTNEFKNYGYSLTYAARVSGTDTWQENLVISDVLAGKRLLSSNYGDVAVEVEAGRVTYILWVVR